MYPRLFLNLLCIRGLLYSTSDPPAKYWDGRHVLPHPTGLLVLCCF